MAVPQWMWLVFIFAFGCCVGSFLNVVIYRLPRGKSLVRPGSSCPACGHRIHFYDNIPLVSWVVLRGRCRYCKKPISFRYFVIEFVTGAAFVGLYLLYFRSTLRSGIPAFAAGGWLIYAVSVILAAGLIAASAIDLELWVIPICVCWFVTAAGFVAAAAAGYFIDPQQIRQFALLPAASATSGVLAVGAAVGMGVAHLLLLTGVVKRSYLSEDSQDSQSPAAPADAEGNFNHRLEVLREVLFLLPIIICSAGGYLVLRQLESGWSWWVATLSRYPLVSGFLGSLWGYFVGCGVVWATRIFGTLLFGREAMGLGDVHLMGAAGAVVEALLIVPAFFIAPFFGLAWAGVQMFFKKTRQIPYGPFLSAAVFVVIILHDWIINYWVTFRYNY